MGVRADGPPPEWAKNIVTILVRPQNEGNIGAVARCMMNFGLTELRIAGESPPISEVGRSRAKHAQSILDATRSFNTLDDSLQGLSLAIGTSGKRELGEKTAHRHFLLPNELPKRIPIDHGKICLLYTSPSPRDQRGSRMPSSA